MLQQVLAFHVNAVLGLNQVPPTVSRMLPTELVCNATVSKACPPHDNIKRQCAFFRNWCQGSNEVRVFLHCPLGVEGNRVDSASDWEAPKPQGSGRTESGSDANRLKCQ